MNINDVKRAITTFADHPSDVVLEPGRLLVQVRDELIEASVFQRDGSVWIDEAGFDARPAYDWIVRRVAHVPQLADRILSYIPAEDYFVTPPGRLLDQLDEDPTGTDSDQLDATDAVVNVLSRRPTGTSTVLYLTSDAGEGKTTVINHVARLQANRFKNGSSDWLLVPISLGGRPFLRFDDVVVGDLVNRLRFQYYYYDAFLELTRLGVLVPAFDGFEEMFVETSSGEAVSALGSLVQNLDSRGSVLIAARRAYFEFSSFRTQARLLDTLGQHSVAFSRVALPRWGRQQFSAYCSNREFEPADELYESVADRLGIEHPLLTRAVLVEKLVDIAEVLPSHMEVLDRLGDEPDDYFADFVGTIVDREATEKWVDRTGEAAAPLLSVEAHFDLLALVAQEMWLMRTEALRRDYIDLLASIYAEERGLGPDISQQIRVRLPQHSLLAPVPGTDQTLTFDHDDFQRFFLGRALGRLLMAPSDEELASALNVGAVPTAAAEAASRFVCRELRDSRGVVRRVVDIGAKAPDTTYLKENCGMLVLRLLDGRRGGGIKLQSLVFPPDSLRHTQLNRVEFVNCNFRPTTLLGTELADSEFVGCRFHRLEAGEDAKVVRTKLRDCDVDQWVDREDVNLYDPVAVEAALQSQGFQILHESRERLETDRRAHVSDGDRDIAERALRIYMRATHINDAVFRQRLGQRAKRFFDFVLPKLLERKILVETVYRGSGRGTRYKLNVAMRRIAEVVPASRLTLDELLDRLAP